MAQSAEGSMRLGRQKPATQSQLLLLLCAYALARWDLIQHWDSPVFGWRPADLASIALSYYRNGFHFAYPQVFWGGNGPGYVEMEFPIVPFVTGFLLKLLGVHEFVFVLLPLLCGFGLVWITYRFGSYFFDAKAGVAGGLIVAAVPVLVMLTNQGQYADPPMVFFASLGLYWFVLWSDDGGWARLAAGTACVALAVLVKLTGLYIGVPIAYLLWRRFGSAVWKAPELWATGAGVLVPTALWYVHAHHLYTEYHNTFGILGAGYSKFGSTSLLTSPRFYLQQAWRVALYHLTPIGAVGFLVGLAIAKRERVILVFSWLLALAIYTLVTAGGVEAGHYHYLLPLLPCLAMVAGAGMSALFERAVAAAERHGRRLGSVAAAVLLVLFAANAAVAGELFVRRDRSNDSPNWLKKKLTGQRLKPLIRPGALLIVVDTQMDDVTPERSMTPPDVFYFSDRRGWYLSVAWLDQQKIEERRALGARYLVVSGNSALQFKSIRPDMHAFLSSKYRTLMDDQDGLLFDLGAGP